MSDIVACACGCGNLISPIDSRGRPIRFFKGHSSKLQNYIEPESKICGICKQLKLINNFYYKTFTSKSSGDKYKRFRFECIECCNQITKMYFEINGDKVAVKQKMSRDGQKNNIDYHVKERISGWKSKTPNSDLTVEYLVKIYHEQKGLCYYTDEDMIVGSENGKVGYNSLSLDKLNPILGYVQNNVVWCTYLSNTVKQNMSEPDFYNYVLKILKLKGCLMTNKEKLNLLTRKANLGTLPEWLLKQCETVALKGEKSCSIRIFSNSETEAPEHLLGPTYREEYINLWDRAPQKTDIDAFNLKLVQDLKDYLDLDIVEQDSSGNVWVKLLISW